MFLRLSHAEKFVIICTIIGVLITGCAKKDNADGDSNQSGISGGLGFMLDFQKSNKPQVLKSELFLGRITVQQYHIGEERPAVYLREDFSKIIFYYGMAPLTKTWSLNKIDFQMKDGSVKTETCKKVWNVNLGITNGKGGNPVSIEQRFEQR